MTSAFFFPMALRRMSASPMREAGESRGDLHDLLLVHHDAIGSGEDGFHLGQLVGDLASDHADA